MEKPLSLEDAIAMAADDMDIMLTPLGTRLLILENNNIVRKIHDAQKAGDRAAEAAAEMELARFRKLHNLCD